MVDPKEERTSGILMFDHISLCTSGEMKYFGAFVCVPRLTEG